MNEDLQKRSTFLSIPVKHLCIICRLTDIFSICFVHKQPETTATTEPVTTTPTDEVSFVQSQFTLLIVSKSLVTARHLPLSICSS